VFLDGGDIRAVLRAVDSAPPGPDESLLLLVAERERPDIPALIAALRDRNVSFMGGIFPGLIHGERQYDRGILLRSLPTADAPVLIPDLLKSGEPLSRLRDALPRSGPRYTLLVFVDGLAADVSGFLAALFHHLGRGVSYFGGGAGSLSLAQEPCVFTRDGFLQDAAVAAMIPLECSLGVRHGWRKIMGPLVATRTRRNVVVELNWEPAFDVYRRVVEADVGDDSGEALDWDDFFSVARRYPFGIFREGAEDVVRDPISVTDAGELICVGDVPENTVLNVLKGEPELLVGAAAQALTDSLPPAERGVRTHLVIDCISRVLYLQEDFEAELQALQGAGEALAGVLSLGEIASRDGVVEFFNKTVVIGALYE